MKRDGLPAPQEEPEVIDPPELPPGWTDRDTEFAYVELCLRRALERASRHGAVTLHVAVRMETDALGQTVETRALKVEVRLSPIREPARTAGGLLARWGKFWDDKPK